MTAARKRAIESGVRNAVDTVVIDKAMSRDEAFRQLEGFISDGLSSAGERDKVSPEELAFARNIFPI